MTHIAELAGSELHDAPDRERPAALPEGFSAPRWPDCDPVVLVPQWRALAQRAASPNPFCEEWFVRPGLRAFDPPGETRLAMLVCEGRLVGLMPIAAASRYHGRPIPHLAGWTHPNSFCGEPLLAPGYERAFWTALLVWADRQPGLATFLHLAHLPADGAAHVALRTACMDLGRTPALVHREQRAVLRHGLSPQDHLAAASSKKRRKDWARRRRRMEEEGELRFARHDDAEGLSTWIEEFLALERAGWKGTEGSALASDPRTEALFRDSLAGAAEAGQLQRIAFHLDGRPVAMLASFLTPPHAFSFKTAYDESLARYSPGVLLQLENLALLEREDIALCDSCAAPDHPMIDHIWRDRREVLKLSIPIGGRVRRSLGSVLTTLEARRLEHRR